MSLWGEAPCGSAVHGKVDEMSPAPSHYQQPPPSPPNPLPLPLPDPPPPTGQGGQGRIDDITGKGLRTAVALSTASCSLNSAVFFSVLFIPCVPRPPTRDTWIYLCRTPTGLHCLSTLRDTCSHNRILILTTSDLLYFPLVKQSCTIEQYQGAVSLQEHVNNFYIWRNWYILWFTKESNRDKTCFFFIASINLINSVPNEALTLRSRGSWRWRPPGLWDVCSRRRVRPSWG